MEIGFNRLVLAEAVGSMMLHAARNLPSPPQSPPATHPPTPPGTYDHDIRTNGQGPTGVITLAAPGTVAHGLTVRGYTISWLPDTYVDPETNDVVEVLQCTTYVEGEEHAISIPGLPE